MNSQHFITAENFACISYFGHLQSVHDRIQEWLNDYKIQRQNNSQHTGNTVHIKSGLNYFKETPKRKIQKRHEVRCAGTDSFLSRLFGTRKTNVENFHVRENDWKQRDNNRENNSKQSIDVIHSSVRTGQLDN